ncbi:hypothetical protein ENSA5_00880 [Enhygromyxa salina]|uniref:Uncharacterized protein n=2 Tax=Enhygromyxa salina TaxID=215803 RepID=A0A2S9YL29_9BACT|nr:hypothetical protein ENSA5_00880 [Enhygromyxa salina]
MSAAGCDSEPLDVDEASSVATAIGDDQSLLLRADVLVSETPEAIAGLSPVAFDSDRQVYVFDRDGDEVPDITEALEGTDPLDPASKPGPGELAPIDEETAGFPRSSCRPGFRQAGSRLCISSSVENPTEYRWAVHICRNKHSEVCSYEDLTYLYINSKLDEFYNPRSKWIGHITVDDFVLCGNKDITYDWDPDWKNFEGTCHKNEKRRFWCCHDDNG